MNDERRARRSKWCRLAATLIGAAVPLSPFAAQADQASRAYVSPWRTAWAYEGPRGPNHWAELDPDYAACRGNAQSPIDIRSTQRAELAPLGFEYVGRPLRAVTNNGHTIRVNYDAPGSGDFLTIGAERFELTQFHFHRPSEELVYGRRSAMVAHLMHQDRAGHVLGVAVLLSVGRANAAIQKVWDHMPAAEGQLEVDGVEFDPSALIPASRAYYRYEGSQTAPPCQEGVTWIVLKTPVSISAAQVHAFARLYPRDIRPVQPLNGRSVQESR